MQTIVPDKSITPLSTPSDFYNALLDGVRGARSRITLSSLYLGTGHLEANLVSAIHKRLRDEPNLRVAIHLDLPRSLRRSRPAPLSAAQPPDGPSWPLAMSSADLLLRLCRDPSTLKVDESVSRRVRVGLTLLPRLRGIVARLMPPRFKEGLGVWHAKAFVFDDDMLILSGANLSNDYFTNRQDRYVVVSSRQSHHAPDSGVRDLARYLHGIIDAIATLPGSHILTPPGRVAVVADEAIPDVFSPPLVKTASAAVRPGGSSDLRATYEPLPVFSPLDKAFASGLRRVLDEASSVSEAGSFSYDCPESGVIVRPRWQLGSLGVRADEGALTRLIENLRGPTDPQPSEAGDSMHIATGYFNAPTRLQAAIVRSAARGASVHALTAAPTANGFWGARGVAGAIPLAFAAYLRDFYDAGAAAGVLADDPERHPQRKGLALYEWSSPTGWTFHGKGVWVFPKDAQRATAITTTLVGSPNYGRRGLERDAELQLEFSSRSAVFASRLRAERDSLWARPGASSGSAAPSSAARVVAVGPHLAKSLNDPMRDVWDSVAHPRRALRWRLAWANGMWITIGRRVLGSLF
jgi:CDP-diacylglycerol--glycerol-3-phosphate 3-phosphatidyltransferase